VPGRRKYGQAQRDAIYRLHLEDLPSHDIAERCAAGIDGKPGFKVSPRTVREIVHQERQRRPTSDPGQELPDESKPRGIKSAEHHLRGCTRNDEAFGRWLRWNAEQARVEEAAGEEVRLFASEAMIREYHPEWLELMPPESGRAVETVPNPDTANEHANEATAGNNEGAYTPGGFQAGNTREQAGGIEVAGHNSSHAQAGSPPTQTNQDAGPARARQLEEARQLIAEGRAEQPQVTTEAFLAQRRAEQERRQVRGMRRTDNAQG
jgi:hypothetical protein